MADISVTSGSVNDLAFTWLEAGDPDAPLALCLHGFPDTPEGWRPLLSAVADAGYHAVAPWARGYAATAVPEDGLSVLGAWVADAIAFHETLGGGRPGAIIGHDWGALATYGAASSAPDRFRNVVTMSIPPTALMATKLFDYDQVQAFWYQYVFLQPSAEAIVSHDDFRFLERIWADWSPGFDASAAVPAVKDALRDPANLSCALSTYRAMYDFSLIPPHLVPATMASLTPHTQPTLYLHGAQDGCVPDIELADVLAALPAGSTGKIFPDAGHFLQYEVPDRVIEHVLAYLGTPLST